MVLFVLGIIIAIVGVVAIILGMKFGKRNSEYGYEKASKAGRIGGCVAIVVAVLFVLWSFVVTLAPGQVGMHIS